MMVEVKMDMVVAGINSFPIYIIYIIYIIYNIYNM